MVADQAGPRGVLRFVTVDRVSRPVFVLGAHRSATSAMGRALRRTGLYAGHGEGHVLPLLPRLRATIAGYYQEEAKFAAAGQFTMLAETPMALLEEGLTAIFLRLARAHFPDGAWMEKTPGAEALYAATTYARIWPRARFIVMQRRGVDNLISARLKFPDREFADLCAEWTAAITATRAVMPVLASAAMLVDQHDLACEPARVTAKVAEFLGLGAAPAARLGEALANEHPQRSAPEMTRVTALSETGWSEEEQRVFRSICGEAMAICGYEEEGKERLF